MTRIRTHLEKALAHLNLDDELDRLINPRHTDHDRHAFLPRNWRTRSRRPGRRFRLRSMNYRRCTLTRRSHNHSKTPGVWV